MQSNSKCLRYSYRMLCSPKKKKRTADGNREERDCKCEKNCSVGRGIGFAAAVQKHLEEKQKRTAEGEMVERTAINQKKCQSPPYRKVRNAQQLQCTSAFSVIVPSPASSFPFDIYIYMYICISATKRCGSFKQPSR